MATTKEQQIITIIDSIRSKANSALSGLRTNIVQATHKRLNFTGEIKDAYAIEEELGKSYENALNDILSELSKIEKICKEVPNIPKFRGVGTDGVLK